MKGLEIAERERPKVSAIMLTYNQQRFVGEALRALLSQTHPADEIVISDDASTDGTWEEINRVIDALNPTGIQIILKRRENNLGLAKNFYDTAMMVSHNLVVAFAGDDVSCPERIENIVLNYRATGCPKYCLIHSSAYVMGEEEGRIWRPPVVAEALTIEQMAVSAALHIGATEAFTKALVADFDPLEDGEYEDLVMGYRAALLGYYRYIDKPLVYYRPGLGLSSRPGTESENWLHKRRHLIARLRDAMRIGRQDAIDRLVVAFADWQSKCPIADPGFRLLPPLVVQAMMRALRDESTEPEDCRECRQDSLLCYVRRRPGDDMDREKTLSSLGQSSGSIKIIEGDACWPPECGNAGGWMLLLESGDVLEDGALAAFKRAIEKAGDDVVVMYADHCVQDENGHASQPILKPAPQVDYAMSMAYAGRAVLVRMRWLQEVKAKISCRGVDIRSGVVLAYALMLEALRDGQAVRVKHLDAPWIRVRHGADHIFVSDSGDWQAMAMLLDAWAKESGYALQLAAGPVPGTMHYSFLPPVHTYVSIVVTPSGNAEYLVPFIENIVENSASDRVEIIFALPESVDIGVRNFIVGLQEIDSRRFKMVWGAAGDSIVKLRNMAAQAASGNVIIFLDDRLRVTQKDWIERLAGNCARRDVGVTGPKIIDRGGRIVEAGTILGLRGLAGSPAVGADARSPGYMARQAVQQQFSAITGGCWATKSDAFRAAGGLDETMTDLRACEVDYCLRIRQRGLVSVWVPHVVLVDTVAPRDAGKDAGLAENVAENKHAPMVGLLSRRWRQWIADDPAYHRGLSRMQHGFELEANRALVARECNGGGEGRILAFPGDYYGCGQYRILSPAAMIKEYGLADVVCNDELFPWNGVLRSGASSLVFQRPVSNEALDLLEGLLPLDVFKVFEIDDLLDRIPYKSFHRRQMPIDIRQRIIRAVRRCDRLVVSTVFLADQYGGYCGDVRVVPNFLPPSMWGSEAPTIRPTERSRIRIGWAGGVSHGGDLEMIAEVIEKWARHVDWIFFGYVPERLRPYVAEFHPGVPAEHYGRMLMELSRDWDIAIAPIEDNLFNKAKTNLKLLEYGWCGLPVICSDIGPYSDASFPVVRVKNKFSEWDRAIGYLVHDSDARIDLARSLQRYVVERWTFTEAVARDWLSAWTPS